MHLNLNSNQICNHGNKQVGAGQSTVRIAKYTVKINQTTKSQKITHSDLDCITLEALIRIHFLNAAIKCSGEEINMAYCMQLTQERSQ